MTSTLAAGLLWLAADTVEPQVLAIEWPDGVEIVAATNAGICDAFCIHGLDCERQRR